MSDTGVAYPSPNPVLVAVLEVAANVLGLRRRRADSRIEHRSPGEANDEAYAYEHRLSEESPRELNSPPCLRV